MADKVLMALYLLYGLCVMKTLIPSQTLKYQSRHHGKQKTR